jgi:hypothetical protein
MQAWQEEEYTFPGVCEAWMPSPSPHGWVHGVPWEGIFLFLPRRATKNPAKNSIKGASVPVMPCPEEADKKQYIKKSPVI